MLYPIMMILYAVGMLIFIYQAFRKKHYISFRIVTTIGITCFAIFITYILERTLDLKISVLSVGYLIGIYCLIRWFNYINMYDMSSNIVTTVEKMKEYGYIVFDNNYCYINANTMIKEVFPEVNQWEVEKAVTPSDSFLYNEVIKYLVEHDEKEKCDKKIKVGDSFFQLTIREIEYGKKVKLDICSNFRTEQWNKNIIMPLKNITPTWKKR